MLAEYEKAPAVTRERMYLDTMQQIYSSTTKIYVDQKAGQNLLYLPIDKIMALTAQQSPQVTTVEAPRASTPVDIPQVPPQPDALQSRRDALRSRDREAGR